MGARPEAHRAEAKQEGNGAPKNKAHRGEAGQRNEEEERNPFVGGGCNQIAELPHPRVATLIRATKAILGYAAVNWPWGRDDLTVGGMLLKDIRIGFCLRGAKELWCSDWILKDYGSTVTVQCGSGWWATGYQPCAPNLRFDFSAWTLYDKKWEQGPHALS